VKTLQLNPGERRRQREEVKRPREEVKKQGGGKQQLKKPQRFPQNHMMMKIGDMKRINN
jgi:hypothetical protein